jgi:hypothetical protein
MAKKTTPSIKKEDTYAALRDKGYGAGKAAAIANAQANDTMSPSQDGSKPPLTNSGQRTI